MFYIFIAILSLAITYMHNWMMFACLFCIQPSFWALLFIFQLTVCVLIQNDCLIMSLICLKILQLPFRTKSEFRDLSFTHFFQIQYIASPSLCHMPWSTRDTAKSLPWRHAPLEGIGVLFSFIPKAPSPPPLLLYRAVYLSYAELLVILLECLPVGYLFAWFLTHLAFKNDSCQIQSPLSSFPWTPTSTELGGLSSMSHWPQWWLHHFGIIATLLVPVFLEGWSGVLIIVLRLGDMASGGIP